MKKVSLSHAEMILIAIYRASNGTTNRVAFESIVLQAWKDFPREFSLNNHPEYPDAYVVSKRLYSDLITKRLVVSLHKQAYRLTNKGLELAEDLQKSSNSRDVDSKIPSTYLNRDEQEFIDHALRSRAFLAWKQGKRKDLIDYDLRFLLQFSTATPVRERKRKLENAREAIEKAVRSEIPNAESLQSLLVFLIEKFSDLFKEV